MHSVCGRLRGKTPPPKELLDRLQSVCATWRVHWYPATTAEGEPRWLVADHRAGDEYRAVGQYRLRRFEAERQDLLAQDPMIAYGSELMIDGGYIVAYFRDEEFTTGNDLLWHQLQKIQAFQHDQAVPLADARYASEWGEVRTEFKNNADYEQYWHDRVAADPRLAEVVESLNDAAWDAKDYHLLQRRSVVNAGLPSEAR